jgi:hypothetical protein
MKKLFFAALVATVAVGGAFTSKAITVYPIGTDIALDCTGGLPDCSVKYPTVDIRVFPTSNSQGQNPDEQRLLTELNYTAD